MSCATQVDPPPGLLIRGTRRRLRMVSSHVVFRSKPALHGCGRNNRNIEIWHICSAGGFR